MIEFAQTPAAARAALAAGQSGLLVGKRIDDLETPVSAYLKLAGAGRKAFLLESVEGGAYRGRYSAIGLDPDLQWRCLDGRADAAGPEGTFVPQAAAPLASLRAVIEATRLPLAPETPPLAAGLFGYFGYDMIRAAERLPEIAARDPLGLPDAWLLRPQVMVVFDALAQTISAYAPVRPAQGGDPAAIADAAFARIKAVFTALDGPAPERSALKRTPLLEPASNMSEAAYRAHVARAKDYIKAGDIFQVVLSQRFSAPLAAPPFALYRSLRRTNPSPFLYFFDFEDAQIVGSSPEILVRVRQGRITLRPVAGTRPRGRDRAEDEALAADLMADPKERAEHLMLLDLGRNDAGRAAKSGTVDVTQREVIERYSQVMHLVSQVEADLAEGEDALSALLAGFPAGTVSGAPKVRAMEIIEAMELHRRGVYAGAVGYFGANGDLDTCIALRTAVVKEETLHVQAGAGVVLDSDPEAERVETVNKAAALFRAAEDAWRFG